MQERLALAVTLAFSVLGVLGDYLIKRATLTERPLTSRWFAAGFLVYASTAFGWLYVMRHLKMATVGAVYSVTMILLLTTIGVTVFREPLHAREVLGLALAIASLLLLMRFA